MKVLLSLVCLVLSFNTFSQTQDLIALAKGDYLGMNALYDEKGSLFGYISLYNYGKSGERTKKFEYVVLDKNLNPFANNTFEGDITAANYTGYINFDGRIVLKPSRLDASLIKKSDMYTPSSMVIDLKDNSIRKKVFYDFDHGTFKEILQHESWKENKKEIKVEKKREGFNYVSYVVEIKEGGFLVLDYNDYGSYEKDNRVMRFDEDRRQLWSFEYNANGSIGQSQVLHLLDKDENYVYGLLREKVKNSVRYHMLVIDMKTGKEVHKKEIPDPDDLVKTVFHFSTFSYGALNNRKIFEDKIVLVGRQFGGFAGNYLGVTRLLIDKRDFSTDIKLLSYKNDFKKFVPQINMYGQVEKKFILDPRDIFFLKDGSVGVLFEKYKAAGEYNAQKTTDMVYVYMDKDFKITGAKIFEKEKSKWQNADYLFSQNLNDDADLVFFYRDYQKDSETRKANWNLFINTLIDGKFNQEMIPISSKENFLIIPFVAKEGYILLQEFNVKAKYNQIRLERLNY